MRVAMRVAAAVTAAVSLGWGVAEWTVRFCPTRSYRLLCIYPFKWRTKGSRLIGRISLHPSPPQPHPNLTSLHPVNSRTLTAYYLLPSTYYLLPMTYHRLPPTPTYYHLPKAGAVAPEGSLGRVGVGRLPTV